MEGKLNDEIKELEYEKKLLRDLEIRLGGEVKLLEAKIDASSRELAKREKERAE